MNTIYDWLTILVFAGLVTLFLARSADPDGEDEPMVHYLVAAVGCAATNWTGNHGHDGAAAALLVTTLVYIVHFLLRRPSIDH